MQFFFQLKIKNHYLEISMTLSSDSEIRHVYKKQIINKFTVKKMMDDLVVPTCFKYYSRAIHSHRTTFKRKLPFRLLSDLECKREFKFSKRKLHTYYNVYMFTTFLRKRVRRVPVLGRQDGVLLEMCITTYTGRTVKCSHAYSLVRKSATSCSPGL